MPDIHSRAVYAFTATVLLLAVLFCTACVSEGAVVPAAPAMRTITDMAGRTVDIPAECRVVLSTSPPATTLVYMVAPERLGGWNYELTAFESEHMPARYSTLPVLGGWFGKQNGNYEEFISLSPDLVLEGFSSGGEMYSNIEERQEKFGDIPVVGIENTVNATGYSAPILFAGELLGESEQAEKLNSFYTEMLALVRERSATIPEDERVRVYYAEGPAGLQTDPAGSQHSELIELAGGINCAECAITPGYGRSEVSIEQVISWDPDVILAGDPGFYEKVFSDPLWEEISAVKNDRVYLIPMTSFCWFDRPPGVNRIIGIPWTAWVLYPGLYPETDIRGLVKEFHSDFLHYDLTDAEIDSLLHVVG